MELFEQGEKWKGKKVKKSDHWGFRGHAPDSNFIKV